MLNCRKKVLLLVVIMGSALLFGAGNAMGAGVAIIEQSAPLAGNAYAGSAAAAKDASTIFFNPAGMTNLSGNELQIGGHLLMIQSEFKNHESTSILGTPLTGDNGDGDLLAFVPNLYYVHSISDKWKAGIGITAPWGLSSDYNEDWVGRYHALLSEMETLNINPSVAYKFSDKWSIGLGIDIQRAKVELTSAVDYGTILTSVTGDPSTSQNLDGECKIEGEEWGFGGNIGLMFEPKKGTRFGLHYRSSITYDVDADVDFETPAPAAGIAAALGLVNGTAKAEMTMPETVSFSAYHTFNEKWAVLADVTWTKWSHWDELRVELDSGASDNVTTLKWEDAFRVALGGIYKPMATLELRAGVAFDESPVPSAQFRTPRVPDADRIWVALGAGYQFSDLITLDLAYTHIFIDDPKIDKDITEDENLVRGALVGEYDANVNILSASVSLHF